VIATRAFLCAAVELGCDPVNSTWLPAAKSSFARQVLAHQPIARGVGVAEVDLDAVSLLKCLWEELLALVPGQ
jgi:hypothetical protein